MEHDSLAIIIPAYKPNFLEETLKSLSLQTDKAFNVYIGDDSSAFPLDTIAKKYSQNLNITYKRFPNNLGKKNLIGHWNRCLDMIQEEEFFCMFSDDDMMENNCINAFRKTLKNHPDFNVYHFDINIISANGKVLKKCIPFAKRLSTEDFFMELYRQKIDARMPEFIFRTEHFKKNGGFINFPKAYRSDNATVMSCAAGKGIMTINDNMARVLWRDSGINVSTIKKPDHLMELSDANIEFFNWAHRYFNDMKLPYPLPAKTEKRYIADPLIEISNNFNIIILLTKLISYHPASMKYFFYAFTNFLYKYIFKR